MRLFRSNPRPKRKAAERTRRPFLSAALGGLALLLVSAPAFAWLVLNEASAVPIDVDGAVSEPAYGSQQPLDFVSGSLYRGENDPRQNSRIYAVLAQDAAEKRGNYALFVRFDFLRRTLPFAAGEKIGEIQFPISTDGGKTQRNVTVTLRGGAKGMGACDGTIHFEDGKTPDAPLAAYGMKAAAQLATGELSATTPYLHVELKAPSLWIPKSFGAPFPNRGYTDGFYLPATATWTANFMTDANALGQQSEARITINPPNVSHSVSYLTGDNDGLAIRAEVDVKPGNSDNVIGSADNGVLVVAIVSQPQLGAADVNIGSVSIGDPNLSGRLTPSKVQLKDINNDGLADWVINFDLTANHGAIGPDSTVLLLRGVTVSGTAFEGKDSVTIR